MSKYNSHSQKIINLNPDNILSTCCSFIEKNKINITDISFGNLQCLMIKEGYSFVMIEDNVTKKCWEELLIRYTEQDT